MRGALREVGEGLRTSVLHIVLFKHSVYQHPTSCVLCGPSWTDVLRRLVLQALDVVYRDRKVRSIILNESFVN